MTRRCEAVGIEVRATDVTVTHANSSTLQAGYHEINARTYKANMDYYAEKDRAEDFTAGEWSLARRRAQSWD